MERIPFDVQHIALVTADLWIVRVDTAKLQEGSTGYWSDAFPLKYN